jgi:hypothetical protein
MKVEEKSSHLPTESELLLLVAEVEKRILESKLPLIPKTDYEFIVKFVRTKKFNVEKATKAIQKYYESIFRILRRIEGTKPSLYSSVFASNSMAILKHRINDQRILHANFRNWDTKEFGMREIQCAGLFVVEELLAEVETQLNGAIIICDLDGFGFSHLRQCTIPEVKIAIQTVLDGVPAKVKGIHFLNAPSIFWPIYKIVSKLLPEKMQKRVHFHSNLESLHNSSTRIFYLPVSVEY